MREQGRLTQVVLGGGALSGVLGLASLLGLFSFEGRTLVLLDVLLLVAGATAALATIRRAAGRGRPTSNGWRLLGGAGACLALAGLLDLERQLRPHGTGTDVAASDVALVGALVFGLVGLSRFVAVDALGTRRQSFLDAVLVAAATIFITWTGPLDGGQVLDGASPLAIAGLLVALGIAGGVCGLILAVVTTVRHEDREDTSTLVSLVFVALLGFAGAAGTVSALVEGDHGGRQTPAVLLCLVATATALWSAAGGTLPWSAGERTVERGAAAGLEEARFGARSQIGRLVPMLATFGALATGVTSAVRGPIHWSVGALALACGVILLLRELLLGRDNEAVLEALEHLVDERTAEVGARERYFRSLVQNTSDVVVVVDGEGVMAHVSDSIVRVLGLDPADVVGQHFLDLVDPEDQGTVADAAEAVVDDPGFTYRIECRVTDAEGLPRAVDVTVVNLLADEDVRGVVCNLRDVTESRELREQLTHAAYNDHLTQLANRGYLLHKLNEAIAEAGEHGRIVGLVFLDLDGFKQVNDTLGHQAGDALLKVVAERIVAAVRPGDTVARLGGDEFAILLEDLSDPGNLGVVCGRLVNELASPVDIDGQPVRVQASIGTALSGAWAQSGEELLRNADLAMYAGKQAGKGRVEHFRRELLDVVLRRAELEAELRRALDHDELVLYYQPLVDLETDTIISLEALVRWRHPERGLVPPGEFIPVAEQSDLINELGRWALQQACGALARLSASSTQGSRVSVAVNISGRHLASSALVNDVAQALLGSGVDGSRLTIEVTETLLFDETLKVIQCLTRLRKLKCKVAIDDFGTGYSSLSKLSRLPIDTLKLDGSFVQEMAASPAARAVVSTVLDLGHSLGLGVVGEGIETSDQLAELRSLGLRIGQGYHLMRPVPLDDLEAVLTVADRAEEVLPRSPDGP